MRDSKLTTLLLAAIGATLLAGLLSGCGVPTAAGPEAVAIPALHGFVHGGQQPVSGSTIQLYAAGNTGYGSAAMPLLPSGVTTDSSGAFNITGDYTCPSSSAQVYMTATGGNPGLTSGTDNSALAMMVALGNCGSLNANTNILLNEVTTVAAVWALAQFISDYAHVGTSATNAAGLQAAFFTSAQLADAASGAPAASTATTVIPAPELNTLGNVLSVCVNSTGTTTAGSPCGLLFAAATPAGANAPTNTIAAALNIAHNPVSNTGALYALSPATAPFQPSLASAPLDWTVGILTWNGLQGGFSNSAIVDASNNFWSPDFGGSVSGQVSISGPDAQQVSNIFFSGASFSAFGLDGTLYASTPENTYGFGAWTSSGALFTGHTGGGITSSVDAGYVAVAANGNLWFPLTNGNLAEIETSGTALSGSSGFSGLSLPTGMYGTEIPAAFDASGYLYVANAASKSIQKIDTNLAVPSAVSLTGGGLSSSPDGLAVDHSGNVWVANSTGGSGFGSLSEFDKNGNALSPTTGYLGGGLDHPTSLAIDGTGMAWVSNNGAGGISVFTSLGKALAPYALATAFATTKTDTIAIDEAGNVWSTAVSNGVAANLELVGAAAPVTTPLALAVKNNVLGARP